MFRFTYRPKYGSKRVKILYDYNEEREGSVIYNGTRCSITVHVHLSSYETVSLNWKGFHDDLKN